MKIVLNRIFGGFSLSEKAYEMLGLEWDTFGFAYGIERNDPRLVEVVEKLGEDANGKYAKLEVVTVPDGIDWEIDSYDGLETVEERHRSWP